MLKTTAPHHLTMLLIAGLGALLLACGVTEKPVVSPDDQCAAGKLSACEQLCKAGSVEPCVVVGKAYLEGDGLSHDPEKGLAFLEKACDHENPDACGILGKRLLDGLDAPKNPVAASVKLRQACFGHHAPSCASLGTMLKYGKGISKNLRRATELLRSACNDGVPEACYEVADSFLFGTAARGKNAARILRSKGGCGVLPPGPGAPQWRIR